MKIFTILLSPQLRKSIILLFRSVLVCVTVILVINVVIILFSHVYTYSQAEKIPHAQVAVILGAAILRDGSLSPVLMDRVTTAVALYKNRTVENILVTGDNGSLAYNEVNPVRLYLLSHGIPDKDIFLDHAGFDTYSSMYRARDIFLAQSMIIVSQSFHLPRAIFIARNLGIDAYGVSADNGHYLLKNYIREIFANCKAVMNLIFHRQPKYLGKEIPLSGDGRDNQ